MREKQVLCAVIVGLLQRLKGEIPDFVHDFPVRIIARSKLRPMKIHFHRLWLELAVQLPIAGFLFEQLMYLHGLTRNGGTYQHSVPQFTGRTLLLVS